ncbi:AraC family transcriptional regulator [Pseudomonas sp. ZM23]|uniref:AraC family transcriptional regulator n=1 Tax=Pseudomonas triclosanedens TaxID=2961893 RepID=A0ABY6ZZU1_9PSED|nr:AraC family transcriptional regulator [Pseudomonas triclosanedens]MCP8462946.1 AraC family transcriptional regulator [Pseudomonas triclosanedens]MCP8468566.1 AraC family transcriptional regulator [Pseudomonas triclosanedens]MCP8475288.1 AraC family transcriptional regulator [Pseudomonas triclosanedens]WAI50122.1 AraC family transcriptional regulator [Pseudomonas triclosanedens]
MSGMRLAQLGDHPGFEVASATLGGHAFERHSHDEFVISANLRGEERVWLDGRSFEAGPGTLTSYNPGQIQGGGVADGQPWQFVSLYVAPEPLAAALGVARVEFERPAERLPALAVAMADAVERVLCGDGFVRQRGEERLTLLLAEVAQAMGVRLPRQADAADGRIAELQEWLAADLARQPSLDEMAAHLGLSKFHLLRSFQRRVGLSPRQWAMQLRTRRAQSLLRVGLPATEVAHVLGFADQSHLNRHFRAAYGLSPGSYQRALG